MKTKEEIKKIMIIIVRKEHPTYTKRCFGCSINIKKV